MSVLPELRRTRRSRRLGDTEWFDLAYHVYLAGIFGGSAIIIASDYVGDEAVAQNSLDEVFDRGPAILGIIVALALMSGLRSGASGGPVSIEAPDVRHLLLAPISRSSVLRLPLLQRLRSIIGSGALAGGVGGLLAAQRLPGTAPAWTISGAAFGACTAAIMVAVAAVAHGLRVRPWQAATLGTAVLAWQTAAAASNEFPGPFDSLGSLAFWGHRQVDSDLIGVVGVVVLIVLALLLVGRLRVENLARRGDLVSQLRFAVTMQDLRTVVLLRRQLRQERLRAKPWLGLSPQAGDASRAAIRRGVHGLNRIPAGRLVRIVALAAAAGLAAGIGFLGTTAAVVACGVLLFILGLDLVEPLSQEVDHPDRTAALPIQIGWLHIRLLVAPMVMAVPAAMVGALVCTLVVPEGAAVAFVLAVPVVWMGMAGSIVNVVREDASAPGGDSLIVPPEMAGFKDFARLTIPVMISSMGAMVVIAMRYQPDAGMMARCLGGLALLLALVRWWIVHRIDLRRRWDHLLAGARP